MSDSEVFKALSYLIYDLHQKHIVNNITDNIAKAINTATKRIWDELVEATEQLVLAAAESKETGAQLKTDCQETITKFKGIMEGATALAMVGRTQADLELNGGEKDREENTMQTYTDRVKNKVPPTHATAVVRVENQKRKIRLIKAMGMTGEGTNNMTEKQLVEKANMTLGLMVAGKENRPVGAKFVGANKERGLGGVSYEMNTEEAAGWLKEKTMMADFLSNMC